MSNKQMILYECLQDLYEYEDGYEDLREEFMLSLSDEQKLVFESLEEYE